MRRRPRRGEGWGRGWGAELHPVAHDRVAPPLGRPQQPCVQRVDRGRVLPIVLGEGREEQARGVLVLAAHRVRLEAEGRLQAVTAYVA